MKRQDFKYYLVCIGACIGLAWQPLAAAAMAPEAATPILQYDQSGAQPVPVYRPALFGSTPQSAAQAEQIVQSWKVESVTMPWTTLMLEMIVKHKIAPTRAARGSALLHVAMHDAYLLAQPEQRKVAVSVAAALVLGYWFTAEEHGFDRTVAAVIGHLEISDQEAAAGIVVGARCGRATIAHAEADGAARGWNGVRLQWYGEGRYYGPGAWQPTAPYFYYPPNEPFAPTWTTWVLKRPGQLRPTPPAFGSPRFMQDLRELVDLQAKLTDEQKRIAKFWVDGSGSVTPPGHWNRIAQELVRKNSLDERRTVRLFAVLNIALADTFIAVWEAKYHYWTSRPVTAANALLGVDFVPFILTPPFPSYVSGHAAFSGAAARVLGNVFPAEAGRMDEMANEAAMSRLYGGIHYRHDNEDGLLLGRAVANVVLAHQGLK